MRGSVSDRQRGASQSQQRGGGAPGSTPPPSTAAALNSNAAAINSLNNATTMIAPQLSIQQQDYWTHHDIDYSWRFPYPDHQQKEYFSADTYVDEDVRRRRSRASSSASAAIAATAPEPWRTRDRMRTQCVALVACLNIGVDPPDVVKPSPCARMECWIDPESMLPAKALKAIGGRLQLQYERWHERARYKTLLDPIAEELRKTLISLRRVANDERVLFHYNGHGVPKPTSNGEIWVYNKGYTQYIPVSLYDLQTWMGGVSAPSVYVFDCSHAGVIIDAFQHFMQQRKDKMIQKLKNGTIGSGSSSSGSANNTNSSSQSGSQSNLHANSPSPSNGSSTPKVEESDSSILASLADPCRHILLASCAASESLPLSPDLPADLFTACLTTPIKMALRWFVSRSTLNTHSSTHQSSPSSLGSAPPSSNPSNPANITSTNRARFYDLIEKLPGIRKPSNRKSPFGELNWIFTAITDSIAWNILPRDIFQKLYRQDLLVSSLFRNYLLAQRIMLSYNCNVISVPHIPQTHLHPLWACWDLVSDITLSQLERYEKHGTPFTPSTFFEEQLTSFEIWLDSPVNQSWNQTTVNSDGTTTNTNMRPPPMQLPIVLQVLLSTDHRLRALQLLARFMDRGRTAVNLALSVGIFPYVLKLLQSPSRELREVLVFIWVKIFALDRGVSTDLSKVEYASYFVQHLLKYQSSNIHPGASGVARSLQSRGSSVAPSPLMRPSYSLSTTPSTTPFHSFVPHSSTNSTVGSSGNSGTTTPHVGAEPGFPFKSHAVGGSSGSGTANTSPSQQEGTASNPPPLDLPPSNPQERNNGTTHLARLREHPQPTATHMHMRAQPLHDPAARTTTINEHDGMQMLTSATRGSEEDGSNVSGLPPTHPQTSPLLQSRVPFPLDLAGNTSISPIHSPAGVNNTTSSAKPSPMLSGMGFNPTSPLLSPQSKSDGSSMKDGGVAASKDDKSSEFDALHDQTRFARETLASTSLQHLLSLFIIACLAHANPKGQQILMQSGLSSFKDLIASHLLYSLCPRTRTWCVLALGKCWQGFGHAKTVAANEGIPEALIHVLMDPVPQVRLAALWSLGAFFGGKVTTPLNPATNATSASSSAATTPTNASSSNSSSSTLNSTISPPQASRTLAMKSQARLDLEVHLGAAMATLINDGSPLVRRELMLSLAELVYFQQDLFLAIATAHPRNRESISVQGWFIWRSILRGCRDCSAQVQEAALAIKGYLKGRAILNQNQLGRMIGSQHNPGLSVNNTREFHENIEEEDGDTDMSRKNSTTRTGRSSLSRTSMPSSTTTSDHERQSIAHIDADDISTHEDMTNGGSEFPVGAGVPPRTSQSNNQPPIRHFTRFKMGHLRPSASAAPVPPLPAGGARRSVEKSSLLKSLETADGYSTTEAPLGTLDERANDAMWTVPKSNVFENAYATFSEPMLAPVILDQPLPSVTPSMTQIRHTKWRHARNQAIVAHARELRNHPPTKQSFVEVAFLQADWESTSCVAFHPYENLLVAADLHSTVGVWNYGMEEGGRERLNTFSNDNPPATKITQLEHINDAAISLLLVASDEGVVRIWRNVHEEGKQQLVTAFVANPQPEVFYNTTTSASSITTGMPSNNHAASMMNAPPHVTGELDGRIVTPTHSYDSSGISSSSLTPQARINTRLTTGMGIPTQQMAVGMRHSASTPAIVTPPSRNGSRSGSLVSVTGSLIPGSHASNPSPTLKPVSSSPNLQPASGAINIPSYSLGPAQQPQQSSQQTPPLSTSAQATARQSPNHSPPQGTLVNNNNASTASLASQPWPMSAASASTRRKQRPPLIVEWQQNRGRLFASGNGLEHLRIWDVQQEQCVGEIPILGHESLEPHVATYVTSMNTNGGDMAWLGCYDGALRCFDVRLPPLDSLVSTARLHRSPVQSVRLQRHGHDGGMLLSASIGGDIALADIRQPDSSVVRYHRSSHKDKSTSLDAFAVHDYSPLCASGSHKPFIEIFDHAGNTLETIKYHVGFLGQRIGPINTLAFHRHKLLLAAGSLDSYISIFAGEKNF